MPVTTTRRIRRPRAGPAAATRSGGRARGRRLQRVRRLEQADAQAARGVDLLAVGGERTLGGRHGEPARDDALNVDLIAHLLYVRLHLSKKAHLIDAERAAQAAVAAPGHEKADQLPHGVKP